MRKAFGDPSLFPLKGRIGNIIRILMFFWIFRIFAQNCLNEEKQGLGGLIGAAAPLIAIYSLDPSLF